MMNFGIKCAKLYTLITEEFKEINMKKKTILVFTILLLISQLFSEKIIINKNESKKLFTLTNNSDEQIKFDFALDYYNGNTIEKDGKSFIKLDYPDEGRFIKTGLPELPRFSRLITIPENAEYSVKISDIEFEILNNVVPYPAQPLQFESEPPRNDFVIDNNFYNDGSAYPSSIYKIGEPAYLRELKWSRNSTIRLKFSNGSDE